MKGAGFPRFVKKLSALKSFLTNLGNPASVMEYILHMSIWKKYNRIYAVTSLIIFPFKECTTMFTKSTIIHTYTHTHIQIRPDHKTEQNVENRVLQCGRGMFTQRVSTAMLAAKSLLHFHLSSPVEKRAVR